MLLKQTRFPNKTPAEVFVISYLKIMLDKYLVIKERIFTLAKKIRHNYASGQNLLQRMTSLENFFFFF